MSVIRFLAIKMLQAPSESVNGREMQKNLNEGELYSFFDGVHIDEDKIVIPSELNLYDIKGRKKPLSIIFSAIVGENGSGKSTLVDYVLRILNNLATYIFGESYRFPAAEHLHYVFNVYAELYVQVGNSILEIHCAGDELIVYRHGRSRIDSSMYERDTAYPLIKDKLNPSDIINEHMHLCDNVLGDFCYTIITNFSLYSLCAVNYKNENTQYRKENEIRKKGQKMGYDTKTLDTLRNDAKAKKGSMASYYDAQSWLQGLFVKDDGYQIPVNISPTRTYGRIDVQKEYKLAKDRMLSLVFLQNEDGEHTFSKINGKLLIDGISISKDFSEEQKYSNFDWANNYLGSLNKSQQMDIISIIRQSVCSNCNIQEDKRDHSELVWNYIVNRILKIVFTYPRYAVMRDVISTINSREINGVVKDVLHDHSHVTRKLFRSIYYLKYGHINKKKNLKIEEFGSTIYELVKGEKDKSPMHPQYTDELLPPPIFYVDFDLYDLNEKQRQRKIKFSALSSGEKQITYTLSSFFYQLIHIDSSGDVKEKQEELFSNVGGKDLDKTKVSVSITYKYVCAIFDEIELYYHPEMQRVFVKTMLDGLRQLDFRQIEGLHIVLATHSPFILSDIPVQNVLFLGKDGMPKRIADFCTFGANIHSMLKHSFFLKDGTIGEFARITIRSAQNTMNRYLIWHEIVRIMNDVHITPDLRDERIEYLKECKRKQLSYLPEGLLKKWVDGDNRDEIVNEWRDFQWVSKIIDIIQEPIIKTIMSEQLKKWDSYVAFRD